MTKNPLALSLLSHHRYHRIIAAIAATATLTTIASAQDTTAVIPIDTLAITVTRGVDLARAPAAISVIERERIQAGRLGVSLDEALADVPGVLVNNRYNFALGTRISLRGFGARAAFGVRGIRVLADGIPLTMADGQTNLNNVDLTSVGRIEVLRGAASMLHGNAAGGVIEIHSEQPPPGFFLEARGALADLGRRGMNDLNRFNVKLGGGGARSRYLISAARIDASGSREHSRFEQNNLSVRLERSTGAAARTALTLSVADAPIAENPGSLPRDSAEAKPQMAWPRNIATAAGESSRQIQLGIEHHHQLHAGELRAAAYGVVRTLDNPLPFAYITLDRKAGGGRSTFSWRRITLGFDVEAQEDQRAEYANVDGSRGAQRRDQTDRIASVGSFARTIIELSTRAAVSAGLRYDRVRFEVSDRYFADSRDDSGQLTMSAVSPAAGVTYGLSPRTTLFASASTSFQTPTTTELINAPPAPGQPCCAAGFNRLDPQRAVAFELGARGSWANRLSFDAALYHMSVRDALVPYQLAEVPGRDFFRNAGKTRHRGLEVTATAALTRNFELTTSYTYSDLIFKDDGIDTLRFEGNRVPGVPPHHWVVRPGLRTPYVVAEPEAELTSRYFADDANTQEAENKGVAIINLRMRAARPIGRTRLMPFAALNNLTGERYSSSVVINAAGGRYFEPAPGRNFFVGLTLQGAGKQASR